jgi:nicotinamide riboside kinase
VRGGYRKMGCFKVNFCAAPSSGKSTVCSGLESLLKQNNINADTSKEYVRQFIQTYGVPTDLASQFIIHENQESRDKGVASVSEVMLSDNPAVASYVFGKRMLNYKLKREGRREPTKEEYKLLEELHKKTLEKVYWYDLIVVLPPLGTVVRDGTRMENEKECLEIYNAIKGFLDVEGVPYVVVEGSVNRKINTILHMILDAIRPDFEIRGGAGNHSLDAYTKHRITLKEDEE